MILQQRDDFAPEAAMVAASLADIRIALGRIALQCLVKDLLNLLPLFQSRFTSLCTGLFPQQRRPVDDHVQRFCALQPVIDQKTLAVRCHRIDGDAGVTRARS